MDESSSWAAIAFDWNRARAFLVTAEEGSFSAAARAMGIAQPTVGRQVAALEDELGVALFERVGNSLELTQTGLDLVEHLRVMADAAGRVSLVAAGQSLSVAGTVRITASELISAHLLPPVVATLRREHPRIDIELVASNAPRDLRRREADVAIRNFKPTQSELIAKSLGDRVARAYATPEYLARVGPLEQRSDLAKLEMIAFDRSERMIQFLRAMGIELDESNFPIVSGNHLVQWEHCKAGNAVAFVMEEVGDAAPQVVRVPHFPELPVPMWLVTHRELRTSKRIRVVYDLIASTLALR